MRKLLYITTVPFDFLKIDGVQKKILSQLKAFDEVFSSKLICRCADGINIHTIGEAQYNILSSRNTRTKLFSEAVKYVRHNKVENIYIRYPKADPSFLILLSKLRRIGCKICVEIPTYPYDTEGLETYRGKIIAKVDRICRRRLKNYVDRIITYSLDDSIFDIPTIKTINGFDFSKVTLLNKDYNDSIIRLIAVSSMFRVHGYERIIEGLHEYYSKNASPKVIFDIVGEGDYLPIYKKRIEEYKLQKYIFLHGKQFGDELSELYRQANIGLNSLAIHRQGLIRESTLKTKEYAAYGLPIVSSSFVDAFDQNGNEKYVMQVPADESPIDIELIVRFYKRIVSNIEINELANEIRKNAIRICSMEATLKNVIDFYISDYHY